jgi:GMP synthase (glutamine-hydrolysing)
MKRKVLVMKTGSTLPPILAYHGDFESWIAKAMGVDVEELEVCSAHEGETPPPASDPAGVVVTGSPAMVSAREPWSEAAAKWLVGAIERETPILGICYGHQLMAHGLGGEVGVNPRGREVGTVSLHLDAVATGDPLLGHWKPATPIHTTHVESVLRLPEGVEVLGHSDLDPFSAFRVGPSAWGVQFHPEFDASIMRSYVDARESILTDEGFDADAIREAVVETPDSTALLRRFGEIARSLRPNS